jgi:hypothetical protein
MAQKKTSYQPPSYLKKCFPSTVYGIEQGDMVQSSRQEAFVNSFLLSTSPKRFLSYCPTDSIAVKLARFLINIISNNIFPLNKDGRFNDSFYRHCQEAFSSDPLTDEITDCTLADIYMRQIVSMLRASSIIYNDNGIMRVQETELSMPQLYTRLFSAFWNDLEWDEIFPSEPLLAKDLKRNRYFLIDITLKHDGKISVEKVANEFFELTGFSRQGDLFSISFLDFYFFTWLNHFDIIRYCESAADVPVQFEVTEKGRKFIRIAT